MAYCGSIGVNHPMEENKEKLKDIAIIIAHIKSPWILINLLETNAITEEDIIASLRYINDAPEDFTIDLPIMTFLLNMFRDRPDVISTLFLSVTDWPIPLEYLLEYEHDSPPWEKVVSLDYDSFIEYINFKGTDDKLFEQAADIYMIDDKRVKTWLIENADPYYLLEQFEQRLSLQLDYLHIWDRVISIGIDRLILDNFITNVFIKTANTYRDDPSKIMCKVSDDNSYKITDISCAKRLVETCWSKYVYTNEDDEYCLEKLEDNLRFIDGDVLNEVVTEKLASIGGND